MPRYRIYYLRESQRQHFRHAPPAAVPPKLKMKDYQPEGEIEASSPYAAWKQMREAGGERRPIEVGDALETDAGALLLCRYVGFEEAQWFVPEPPPSQPLEAPPVEAPPVATPSAAPPPDG